MVLVVNVTTTLYQCKKLISLKHSVRAR